MGLSSRLALCFVRCRCSHLCTYRSTRPAPPVGYVVPRNRGWLLPSLCCHLHTVNNAGIGLRGALEAQSMDTVHACFDTNFFGVLRVTKAVLLKMKAQKAGHIISISSMGGFTGVPFNSVYCATKFAVEGLSESLAPLLRKFNIRCVEEK